MGPSRQRSASLPNLSSSNNKAENKNVADTSKSKYGFGSLENLPDISSIGKKGENKGGADFKYLPISNHSITKIKEITEIEEITKIEKDIHKCDKNIAGITEKLTKIAPEIVNINNKIKVLRSFLSKNQYLELCAGWSKVEASIDEKNQAMWVILNMPELPPEVTSSDKSTKLAKLKIEFTELHAEKTRLESQLRKPAMEAALNKKDQDDMEIKIDRAVSNTITIFRDLEKLISKYDLKCEKQTELIEFLDEEKSQKMKLLVRSAELQRIKK